MPIQFIPVSLSITWIKAKLTLLHSLFPSLLLGFSSGSSYIFYSPPVLICPASDYKLPSLHLSIQPAWAVKFVTIVEPGIALLYIQLTLIQGECFRQGRSSSSWVEFVPSNKFWDLGFFTSANIWANWFPSSNHSFQLFSSSGYWLIVWDWVDCLGRWGSPQPGPPELSQTFYDEFSNCFGNIFQLVKIAYDVLVQCYCWHSNYCYKKSHLFCKVL